MLALLRELRARRPELAQGEIILNVANGAAMGRANRRPGQVLSRNGAGASQLGQIAGASTWRASAGDVAALIQLSDATTGFRPVAPRPRTRPSRTVSPRRSRYAREWAPVLIARSIPRFSSSSISASAPQAEERAAIARRRRPRSPGPSGRMAQSGNTVDKPIPVGSRYDHDSDSLSSTERVL